MNPRKRVHKAHLCPTLRCNPQGRPSEVVERPPAYAPALLRMCRKPDRWMIRSGRYILRCNCSQGWPNPPALTILERTGSLPRCASSSQPTVRPRSRGSLPRLPPLPLPTTARQQSRCRTRYGTAGDRRPNTAFNAGLRDPQGLHDGLDLRSPSASACNVLIFLRSACIDSMMAVASLQTSPSALRRSTSSIARLPPAIAHIRK